MGRLENDPEISFGDPFGAQKDSLRRRTRKSLSRNVYIYIYIYIYTFWEISSFSMTRLVLQKIDLEIFLNSQKSQESANGVYIYVSGEGFPVRSRKIWNGFLGSPPGAPNGVFLADRAGNREVLWKLLIFSIFNPDRTGATHFASKTQPCPQESSK